MKFNLVLGSGVVLSLFAKKSSPNHEWQGELLEIIEASVYKPVSVLTANSVCYAIALKRKCHTYQCIEALYLIAVIHFVWIIDQIIDFCKSSEPAVG